MLEEPTLKFRFQDTRLELSCLVFSRHVFFRNQMLAHPVHTATPGKLAGHGVGALDRAN